MPFPPKKLDERRYLKVELGTANKQTKTPPHVHGAAFSLRAAGGPSSQLSENALHGVTPTKLSAMITISGDEVVFFGQNSFHARSDRFLTVV
jgi:hypothetical protein